MTAIVRPTWHATMAAIARVWAERSTCSARARVGCVLVNDDHQIVASGYNGAPRGQPHCDDVGCLIEGGHCVRALHAEENAIIQCARTGTTPVGTIMYVTHRPCVRCARLIIQAGIRAVVFGEDYDADAMYAKVVNILLDAGIRLYSLSTLEAFDASNVH